MVQNRQSFVRNNQICQKFVDLIKKNMKGWSHKKIILYLFRSFDLLRKKVENNFFMRAALLCANISQIFFSQFDQKYLRCLFKSLFNWSPHFFTSFNKPARTSTDSCENSSAASLNDQLDPNICWKVKLAKYCFQIFNLKQFISLKMGGEVVILANSLISHFQ